MINYKKRILHRHLKFSKEITGTDGDKLSSSAGSEVLFRNQEKIKTLISPVILIIEICTFCL